MQLAFHGYIVIIVLILLLGIFEFCPMEQWPELE